MLSSPEKLLFANFLEFNQFDPVYQEVERIEDLEKSLAGIIEQYNIQMKEKLSLLLFDYMISHLARISRMLSKPNNGHGLLIGLGGNGRKTLSVLACFINNCSIFKVDITGGGGGKGYTRYDWNDDMKNMFKILGIDNKKVAFQLSDSDIKEKYFMEDISSMLNSGEISSLYT